jgi:hypothetical protein
MILQLGRSEVQKGAITIHETLEVNLFLVFLVLPMFSVSGNV